MTMEMFAKQIDRLKETYGERNYPAERSRLIFNAMKAIPDTVFEGFVTDFIGNQLRAPVLKCFNEKAQEYERHVAQDRLSSGFGMAGGGLLSQLRAMEKVSLAKSEFVRERLKLLEQFMKKKLSKEHLDQGLSLILQAVEGSK